MPRIPAGEALRKLQWWLIHIGPRRDITVKTLNGLLTFDSKDRVIGKYLYVKRSYEIDQIHGAMSLLHKQGFLADTGRGTVIDVGASIGVMCVALLKHGYFERALAFEPAPASYRLLAHNAQQNGLADRVLTFPLALSSEKGELELELSGDNLGDHRLRRTNRGGAFHEDRRRTVTVPVERLDQVFAEHPELGSEHIALIWLDIQGHEGQFFEGARRVLSRGIPVVSEFWPYAILRSGMSQSGFCQIVSELFTHFYVLAGTDCQELPVSSLDRLFDAYSAPKEMCQVALVRKPSSHA